MGRDEKLCVRDAKMVEYKTMKRQEPTALSEPKWSYRKTLFTGTGYLYSTCGPLELEIYVPGNFLMDGTV